MTPESAASGRRFGIAPDGTPVEVFLLRNRSGVEARIMTYGATVVGLTLPGVGEVVLGHATLEPYLAERQYFGAIVGRYANRIGGARFSLDGTTYTLVANEGQNQLHGGARGFSDVVWAAERRGDDALALTYRSPDGDQGYPGTLTATVTYSVTGDEALRVDYVATAEKPTVVNLSHHSYFNLAGRGGTNVLGHELQVFADRYLPVDAAMIPTGEQRPVAGTPFDFRAPTAIGARIDANDDQLRQAGGYDHTFVLQPAGLTLAARVTLPGTRRRLELHTTEAGLQVYSGNNIRGTFARRQALCLEAQRFPDGPNHPAFPPSVLRPGETYTQTTIHRFFW